MKTIYKFIYLPTIRREFEFCRNLLDKIQTLRDLGRRIPTIAEMVSGKAEISFLEAKKFIQAL